MLNIYSRWAYMVHFQNAGIIECSKYTRQTILVMQMSICQSTAINGRRTIQVNFRTYSIKFRFQIIAISFEMGKPWEDFIKLCHNLNH